VPEEMADGRKLVFCNQPKSISFLEVGMKAETICRGIAVF